MKRALRILSLQPYFGGSHEQFQNEWIEHSRHDWTVLSLPPRHWKWRMRHASIHFAQEIKSLVADAPLDSQWDAIFCSDMLNVAEFKGLVGADQVLRQALAELPIILYFHENQFEYPTREGFKPDQHFPFTNFISALTADRIWFNSRFNFESMQRGLIRHGKRWPDFVPTTSMQSLSSRVEVQPPGICPPCFELEEFQQQRIARAQAGQPIRIVWAARWEHDKNAEDLLAALKRLDSSGVPFQLSVLGQSFHYSPPAFEEIKQAFGDRIMRWGYQETRAAYGKALAESDVFVSTARHEFFGLAAAEAITTGLHPLFPNRLAYPELLQYTLDESNLNSGELDGAENSCVYDGTSGGLADSIERLIEYRRIDPSAMFGLGRARCLIDSLNWKRRAAELDDAIVSH
ncbi:MAG: glycosyltransferase involved in cell wall biosynthesis [Mariniblastus sp.]|jgi:glycosyltransferase involved in cell wall biosynthesis